MKVLDEPMPGLFVLSYKKFEDNRGAFAEVWRQSWSEELNIKDDFIQDNYAVSKQKNTLRGLHLQTPPFAQAKLVWVTVGSVYDVAVDLRKGSPCYGKWFGVTLSSSNNTMFYLPRGFAHGYLTLEENVVFNYKVDSYYCKEHEAGIIWNDKSLNIEWPCHNPIISDKDKELCLFKDYESPFVYN